MESLSNKIKSIKNIFKSSSNAKIRLPELKRKVN